MSAQDFRLLQVFLSPVGVVSEVSYRESERPYLRCTCTNSDTCPHIAFVAKRLAQSGGHYPFPRVDADALATAVAGTAEQFREFVLTRCAVEIG